MRYILILSFFFSVSSYSLAQVDTVSQRQKDFFALIGEIEEVKSTIKSMSYQQESISREIKQYNNDKKKNSLREVTDELEEKERKLKYTKGLSRGDSLLLRQSILELTRKKIILEDKLSFNEKKRENLIKKLKELEYEKQRCLDKLAGLEMFLDKEYGSINEFIEEMRSMPQNALPNEWTDIQNLFKNDYKNDFFSITLSMDNEMVEGKKGRYYYVDIYSPTTKEIVYFDAGKYVIDLNQKYFKTSYKNFADQVVNILNKSKKPYNIFVMGNADYAGHTTFVGNYHVDTRYHFSNIKVLKNRGVGTQYIYNEIPITLFEPFKNTELPNFRGAFMRYVLTNHAYESFDASKIFILDGKVTSVVNPKDRKVTMLLFVEN